MKTIREGSDGERILVNILEGSFGAAYMRNINVVYVGVVNVRKQEEYL
jgi:hypothetical protein